MDENQIELSGLTVLEVSSGEYQGNAYASILGRYGARVMKFKVDIKKISVSVLNDYIDKTVNVLLEIVPGDKMSATLKIVKIG